MTRLLAGSLVGVILAGAGLLTGTDQQPYSAPVVLVPTYSATYSEQQDTLRAILEELRGLRADLAAGGKAQAPVSLASVIGSKCVGCHGEKVADTKGNGFILALADGKIPPFSLNEKRRITKKIEAGKMPPSPAPALSGSEKSTILKELKP